MTTITNLSDIRTAAAVYASIETALDTARAMNGAARFAHDKMRAATLEAAGDGMIQSMFRCVDDTEALLVRCEAGFPHPHYGVQGFAKTASAICACIATCPNDAVLTAAINNVLFGEVQ